MKAPFALLLVSFALLLAGLAVPGFPDLLLIGGPMVLASLYLLARSWRREPRRGDHVVIDGSNVLHWQDGTPGIAPLQEVIRQLELRGLIPGVVFDANAGYLLAGRYQHDHALGKQLGLPPDRILMADKGVPADPLILQAARDMKARVVTNDRFRDWADEFPEVRVPRFLISGGYRRGELWLDLEAEPQPVMPRAETEAPR